MFSLTISPQEVFGFTAILFRVSGIMVFAPFFNSGAIPVQVKVIVPLVLALTLAPLIPTAQVNADWGLVQGFVAILGELLVGMVLGLTVSFLFAGFQMAGQIVSFQLGFSIVNVIDPQTSVQTSVISILHNFLGLIFFLILDGHHWLLRAVCDSLSYLPVGGVHLKGPLVEGVLGLSSQIFVAGLQIAAPVVAATVIADVLTGIIGRAAPQINILIVGMPVKTLVGLASMSIAFYFLPALFARYFVDLAHTIFSILRGMA